MSEDAGACATVVNKILDMINDNTLKTGNKLPSERVLAEFLSVSRVSVREALKTLSAMKVITIKPREGAYINSISFSELIVQDSLGKLLDSISLTELTEVRLYIEPIVAELAAQRATDEEIENLLNMCDYLQYKASEDKDPSRYNYLKLDLEFHIELCKVAKNRVLFGMISSIINLMVGSMITSTKVQGFFKKGYEGHYAILEALQQRDPQKARIAMVNHLKMAEQDLLIALGSELAKKTAKSGNKGKAKNKGNECCL